MTPSDWVALAAFGSITVAIGVALGCWLHSLRTADRPPLAAAPRDERPRGLRIVPPPYDWADDGSDAA